MYKYCIKTKAARDYIIYIKLSCPELGHRIRIRTPAIQPYYLQLNYFIALNRRI